MKLTVLMSVYNDEEFLEESIESILNQTYKNFDFLIYDDGSTDGSREILLNYSKKDDRIRLIFNEENKGLSYNLHQGIKQSTTEYIARMDADDVALPRRFEKQVEFIKKNPQIEIVGSYVNKVDEKGNFKSIRKVPTTDADIKKIMWTCPIIHPTVIFRKQSVVEAGSYDPNLRRRQDYDLWFRCLEIGTNFANIPEPLLNYREDEEKYYMKNDFQVQWSQLKIGVKGVVRNKLSPLGLLGVIANFVVNILPTKTRIKLKQFMRKIDPRNN